jgi:hypothetical protein
VPDYEDPAIKRMLCSSGGTLEVLDTLPGGADFRSLRAQYGKKGFDSFARKLALRICKIRGTADALDEAADLTTCSTSEIGDFFLQTLDLHQLNIFQELQFSISRNPGKVSVRVHETFHGRKPARAVMIRSPYGKSNPFD